MAVAKSTIARIETLEMSPKADFLTKALRLFRDAGVAIDFLGLDKVVVTIDAVGLQEALNRLNSVQMRRKDRVSKDKIYQPSDHQTNPNVGSW